MDANSSDGASPWDDLPEEMIDEVARHLDYFTAIQLAGVCKSWSRAVNTNPLLRVATPCLLMSREDYYDIDGQGRDLRVSGDDYECTYQLLPIQRLPGSYMDDFGTDSLTVFMSAIRNRWWVGAKGDWLVTVGFDDGYAALLNPSTGDQIDLPGDIATTITANGSSQLRKMVLCVTPSGADNVNGDDYLVIAVSNDGRLALTRGGDVSWTALRNPHVVSPKYKDVIVHKGKVLAIDGQNGSIYAWDLPPAAGEFSEPEIIMPPDLDYEKFEYEHLAESADGSHLLLVCTYGSQVLGYKYRREMMMYDINGVQIYELNIDDAAGLDGGGWRHVTSLGDRALFLGVNYPFFMTVKNPEGSPEEQLLQPNCVYFAADELPMFVDSEYDLMVYSLDSQQRPRSMRLFYSCRYYSFQPPMWFVPTRQLNKKTSIPSKEHKEDDWQLISSELLYQLFDED